MSKTMLPTCIRCGAPARERTVSKFFGWDTTICPACSRKLDAILEWEHEQFEESDICCPYCGYELEDSWEWNDETKATCPSCKREFELEVKTEVSYTTRRNSWDMPSDYPYMTEEQRQEVESGFIE